MGMALILLVGVGIRLTQCVGVQPGGAEVFDRVDHGTKIGTQVVDVLAVPPVVAVVDVQGADHGAQGAGIVDHRQDQATQVVVRGAGEMRGVGLAVELAGFHTFDQETADGVEIMQCAFDLFHCLGDRVGGVVASVGDAGEVHVVRPRGVVGSSHDVPGGRCILDLDPMFVDRLEADGVGLVLGRSMGGAEGVENPFE